MKNFNNSRRLLFLLSIAVLLIFYWETQAISLVVIELFFAAILVYIDKFYYLKQHSFMSIIGNISFIFAILLFRIVFYEERNISLDNILIPNTDEFLLISLLIVSAVLFPFYFYAKHYEKLFEKSDFFKKEEKVIDAIAEENFISNYKVKTHDVNQSIISKKDQNLNIEKEKAMHMAFCRGCGKQIHETAKMCPHCGYQISLNEEELEGKKDWMTIAAAGIALISIFNWAGINTWSHEIKSGLLFMSVVSIALSSAVLAKKPKGKVINIISLLVSAFTLLLIIGRMS
jgi:hypothetical protein